MQKGPICDPHFCRHYLRITQQSSLPREWTLHPALGTCAAPFHLRWSGLGGHLWPPTPLTDVLGFGWAVSECCGYWAWLSSGIPSWHCPVGPSVQPPSSCPPNMALHGYQGDSIARQPPAAASVLRAVRADELNPDLALTFHRDKGLEPHMYTSGLG